MDGRYSPGLLYCYTSCTDPSKDSEFNHWYNHMHVPDVTGHGAFIHGTRYKIIDPPPGHPAYLCTYENNWESVSQAWDSRLEDAGRLTKLDRQSPVLMIDLAGPYKKIGGEFRAASRPVRGIMAVMVNCPDPSRDEEFNDWFNDVHIPDVLDTGLFHTAYRFEAVEPDRHVRRSDWGKATRAQYLIIYETDSDEPDKAASEVSKLSAEWRNQGRFPEGIAESVYQITARRIWPIV